MFRRNFYCYYTRFRFDLCFFLSLHTPAAFQLEPHRGFCFVSLAFVCFELGAGFSLIFCALLRLKARLHLRVATCAFLRFFPRPRFETQTIARFRFFALLCVVFRT